MTLGQVLNREHHEKSSLLVYTTSENSEVSEPGSDRRKRRRTSAENSVEVGNASRNKIVTAEPQTSATMEQTSDKLCGQDVVNKPIVQQSTLEARSSEPRTPPKKMLRLNANGKFSSPIAKPTRPEEKGAAAEQTKRRGRPQKSKEALTRKQLIVCVKYTSAQATNDGSIGNKIDRILAGDLTMALPFKQPPPSNARTPRKPAKATHPFFNEKPKSMIPLKQDSPWKTSAITPGKLRVQAQHERNESVSEKVPMMESALLKDRLMVRHPGAKEPLWPAKGMAHVRGNIPVTMCHSQPRRHKQKYRLPSVHNSLLSQYARTLVPEPESDVRPDGFREPRSDLRLPEKLLMPGAEIATLIAKEVKAPVAHGPPDELALEPAQPVHPALDHVYRSIPSYLSAFDNLQGEQHGWTQKYAPECAELVLQPQRKMQVLKSWLQSLAVNAIDSAKPEQQYKEGGEKRKKKRKIRRSELDDFIVDEADDIRSLGTISDNENPTTSQSMVETQINGVRASNTVLISGPHGCGKTAAVYAVAKELQYRVFEISSSERRAGKDVLDKIGNVTENHIVNRHSADADTDLSGTEDKERIDTAFRQDLESGRQGKMSAFFQPKAAKSISKNKPTEIIKAKIVENAKSAVKRASKDQQQSLILLEEVDILFKEDKEFWTTILKLILTSKRPFIMTCNDEDVVPMQAIMLHAVLRFAPPEPHIAIDYLLLIAAREGHLLQRNAISCLWQTSGHDLRQSLTTLDFWCRMGVGDIRDGLGWIYQRWPIGSDLDAKGRPLRIVSKGTFLAGMGSLDTHSVPASPVASVTGTLEDAYAISQTLSSIDVFSKSVEIDPTLPLLPPKRRAHYIEGLTLLDDQERVDYTHLQSKIEVTATTLARGLHPRWNEPEKARQLTRKDFSPFDALAYPATSSSIGVEASVLDGPFQPVVTEVAPYVRQVVRYEQMLQEQRATISGPHKRARTTRAARSALEGGQRQLTRREYWWEGAGDLCPVLITAGDDWCVYAARESAAFSLQ